MKERDVKTWITVRVLETGDEGECVSPETALSCALHLWEEAWAQNANQGYDPTVQFIIGDNIVRTCQRSALLAATSDLKPKEEASA